MNVIGLIVGHFTVKRIQAENVVSWLRQCSTSLLKIGISSGMVAVSFG